MVARAAATASRVTPDVTPQGHNPGITSTVPAGVAKPLVRARREGLEPPTARSVVCRESSVRWSVICRCCSRPRIWCLLSVWWPVVRLLACRPPSRTPSTTAFQEASTRFRFWCSGIDIGGADVGVRAGGADWPLGYRVNDAADAVTQPLRVDPFQTSPPQRCQAPGEIRRTSMDNASEFTGRTAGSPRVSSHPHPAPSIGRDQHKRPANSPRRHLPSRPVPPRPARPSVGRREGGGKSSRRPTRVLHLCRGQRRGRVDGSTGPLRLPGCHHTPVTL
jgi:hypothetical protein